MQINEKELLKRLMLSDVSFLTTNEKLLLQSKLDSAEKLASMSIEDISFIAGRAIKPSGWQGSRCLLKAKKACQLIKALSISCVNYESDDFPAMLREIADPPYMLFYRGNLECLKQQRCVSVVGTRRATVSARKAAFDFAKDASDSEETVVSGLAFGIDVFAHKGALEGKSKKTCAVLPGGVDTITPVGHTKIALKIIEAGGLLLSEYTPGTPAMNFRFVQRNRLIAGISPAVVIIQAPAASGAMITADFALDYNRGLFFHEAAFNSESVSLASASEKKLRLTIKNEDKFLAKIERTPGNYVRDGAPIIKDYADYKLQMSEEHKLSFHQSDPELSFLSQ